MDVKSDLIDIEVLLIHETDRAIKVSDATREAWLPKSAVEWRESDAGGRLIELTLPQHIAEEKGLV